ncbi:MAG: ATPase, partial [Caldilineaceae bacterium]|nr:ATPase [Caldilineaceae bacterium]
LLKRNRDPDQFDVDVLARASEGLSGAEIEQAVIDGLYEAFDKDRPLQMDDLVEVLQQTVPLSTMMREEIDALRDWARYRARPATGEV